MSSSQSNNDVIEAEVVPSEQGEIITGDELVAMIDISAQLPVISSNFEIIKTHIFST